MAVEGLQLFMMIFMPLRTRGQKLTRFYLIGWGEHLEDQNTSLLDTHFLYVKEWRMIRNVADGWNLKVIFLPYWNVCVCAHVDMFSACFAVLFLLNRRTCFDCSHFSRSWSRRLRSEKLVSMIGAFTNWLKRQLHYCLSGQPQLTKECSVYIWFGFIIKVHESLVSSAEKVRFTYTSTPLTYCWRD